MSQHRVTSSTVFSDVRRWLAGGLGALIDMIDPVDPRVPRRARRVRDSIVEVLTVCGEMARADIEGRVAEMWTAQDPLRAPAYRACFRAALDALIADGTVAEVMPRDESGVYTYRLASEWSAIAGLAE